MYKKCIFTLIVLCLAGSAYAVGLGAAATYSLDTSQVIRETSGFTSLDGTWSHDNGGDEWDGSAIGEGSPGGVSVIDGYLRIQETGDPRDHGFADPGSNRKITLAHDLGPEGASDTFLDDGATFFFRARLATDGPLDQLYPGGGAVTDFPAYGDGYLIHNEGKGNIIVRQESGGQMGFALTTVEENGVASGLMLSFLNGSEIGTDVDWDEGGTLNLIPLDPTVWHDYWITIQADNSGNGTHRIDVYVDGGSAHTFSVTSGLDQLYNGINYIALAVGSTGQSGAFDVAALQFAPGIIAHGPADGAAEVARDVVFSWVSSESASAYDVYLGTVFDDVNNADRTNPLGVLVAQGLQTNTYTHDELLEYGQTYYWRVDEIGAPPESEVIKGNIKSFTVLNYLTVVDDFEDYNDYPPDEIWNTWIDGYGDPTNGSSAGYPDPDFINGEHYVETLIVHSGNQSMPLLYNNSAGLSEVTRTLNADWTQGGVVTFTLFYRGDAANAVEPMYVALNGNNVVTNPEANAVLTTEWTKWDIPLQTFSDMGVNLANVGSMSIGLGNKANPVAGGSGVVYIDDIRLYLPEPL